MMLVTYDPRPESATYGLLSKLVLTGDQPRIVNIPKFVWHADWNIGTGDVVLMNFPTVPYDHANPDKYRLPLDTDLIPFDFKGARGW
jgi:dTDP-4-dehydrorhamnose 3,5-epimerase